MSFLSILRQTAREWSADNAPTLGAALAYYTVFSLAPLFVISLAIAGFVFGEDAARGRIFEELRHLVGDEGGLAVQDVVRGAASRPVSGALSAIVGTVTLLIGASGVFTQLQASLNLIWGAKPRPGRKIVGFVRNRLLSFGFILVVGFLLLVSLLLSAAIAFCTQWMGGIDSRIELVAHALDLVLSLAMATALFALIFKVLPDARIAWRDVWIGAFLTSILFTIGKFALGLYLGMSSVGSSFGAAGSLIVLLLWVYYSAQILFFGAEFTQVWANHRGSRSGRA